MNLTEIKKDFPFVIECEFATIHSKKEFDANIKDHIKDHYGDFDPKWVEKFVKEWPVTANTTIGTIDTWTEELETIIAVTKPTKRVSPYENYSSFVYLEVSPGIQFAPAQSPIDVITDEDDTLEEVIEDETKVAEFKADIIRYGLDHLLLSM